MSLPKMIRLRVLVALLAILSAWAGCATKAPQAAAPAADWGVSFASGDELALVTLERVPGDSLVLRDLVVLVDGRRHVFASEAGFQDARFTVQRVAEPDRTARPGDVLEVPAAGPTWIQLMHGPIVLAEGTVQVVDHRPAAAPMVQQPSDKVTGVSRTPTFEWSPVSDPSGVTYRLVYGVDRDLSLPSLTTRVESLRDPAHSVPADQPLLVGVTYYWHVQAIDGAGNQGAWSGAASFTTGL